MFSTRADLGGGLGLGLRSAKRRALGVLSWALAMLSYLAWVSEALYRLACVPQQYGMQVCERLVLLVCRLRPRASLSLLSPHAYGPNVVEEIPKRCAPERPVRGPRYGYEAPPLVVAIFVVLFDFVRLFRSVRMRR